jgi:NAD+ synthase (glutamine-hydrolysing)
VNTVGAADNGKNIIPFDGESLVYDGAGRLIAIGPQFAGALLVVDLAAAPQPELTLPAVDREREMYDALVMALRDYMAKTGFARAIVAISGGIDSALALAIAVEALGADHVSAYNLPSQYNTDATKSIAARLASGFGVRYGIIPIQRLDEDVRSVFEAHAHPIERSLTRENLHARLRGLLMMAESNDTGALLISCGNETEIALGYATLYGDMCGGLSLIGDLSKLDVYRLARYVNRKRGAEMIPEETFGLVPSAELAANQFDPFDYYVVSPIVGEFVEHRTSPGQLVKLFEQRALDAGRFVADERGLTVYDKHTPETFATVVYDAFRRLRRSVYKRLQGPPIVVVSERAFGFDLRETIINEWEGWNWRLAIGDCRLQSAFGKQESTLGKQESALGKQESALGKQESALGIRNRHSASGIGTRQSGIDTRHSALRNRQSAVRNRHSALGTPQSAVGNRQSAITS